MNNDSFIIDKYNQYNLEDKAKYSTCPICSASRKKSDQKCMMLDWNRGLGTCSHCGVTIQLHTYKQKNQKNKKDYKKPDFINNTELSDKLVKWFENRKISQFTLRHLKVSEGPEFMPQIKKQINTIQFNYFRNNELINVKYRDANKNFKLYKDAELIFYNLDNIIANDEVIIVEGEIDCLSCCEVGYFNTISTPNGSTIGNVNLEYLDNCFEYFENKKKIILALDNDLPGQNVQKELIRRFGAYRCYTVNLNDCKDANEYLIKYGKEALKNVLQNPDLIPLENVLFVNDLKNELRDFYNNGLKGGIKAGIRDLDNVYSILDGNIEITTGIPTHGKSELVDSLMIGRNLNYRYKCAFISPENKPSILHIDKICTKIAGFKPKNDNEFNSYIWQETMDYVNENFFFIDFEESYDLDKCLDKVNELIARKGIKTFVLDPFNKIRLKSKVERITGISILDYTSSYLNKLNDFARKTKTIGNLVAHPTKPEKINGKRQIPDFYDIKGGGEFFDMSNYGLVVHRDFENKTTTVKVLKCKFSHLGQNGAEIRLGYNAVNGRYCNLNEFTTIEIDNNYWLRKEEPIQTDVFNYQPNNDEVPF